MTLEAFRKDFKITANRSISMPLAGVIVWSAVAFISIQLEEIQSVLVLLFATSAIFPIALLIARIRNEDLLTTKNPLGKLLGLSILMVNLFWAVHISLYLHVPELVPLSVGVGLGLHWIVFPWIVKHPVGIIHADLRTALILLAWIVFKESRVLAVSVAVVVNYLISIFIMATRRIGFAQDRPGINSIAHEVGGSK